MVILEASYSKKLGLPAYSSHSYSVTIRSEVADLSLVEKESAKLYALLQASVDREIQETGYVPSTKERDTRPTANGHSTREDDWNCSDKQMQLILRIVEEHRLEKQDVESLSKDRFNLPVKSLDRLQASGLIEELIAKFGPKKEKGSFQRGGRR